MIPKKILARPIESWNTRSRRACSILCFLTTAVSILFTGSSCNRANGENIESRIVSEIKANCQDGHQCLLRIKGLTQFSWDKMFVFRYDASRVDVANALGADFSTYEEFGRKIIFMSKGLIVHGENDLLP